MKALFPSKPLLEFLFDKSSNTCSATKDLQFSFKDYAVQERNAFLWLALILITALLLRQLIKILHLWAKGRSLPGPPCPSFFFGHSKLFSTTETLSDFLAKSHDKYGSIVRLWLGPTQLLVSAVDPEVIKEMLVKAEDKLPLTERLFRRAFGRSILFASSFEEEIYSEIAMACSKSTMSEKYDVQKLNLNDDITVPAGAILVVPVQLVQMEGSSWGSDACQFNPHRFLSNTAMRSESKPILPITGTAELMGPDGGPFVFNEPNANTAFLPFGSGTRACLGQKLAIVGIATLFAYLLECYEIRLQPWFR